jgi:hypothetical protein
MDRVIQAYWRKLQATGSALQAIHWAAPTGPFNPPIFLDREPA